MNRTGFKVIGLIIGVSAIIGLSIASILKATGGAPLDRAEVESIVKEYVLDNPEIVVEALTSYQQNSRERQARKANEYIEENLPEIVNDTTSPVLGNPEGEIVIVEFFDYLCGYCKKAFANINRLIQENDNVKVVLKEFPILSDFSTLIAHASLAVHQSHPEHYLAFHRALMTQRITSKEALVKVATDLGIDASLIENSLTDSKIQTVIAKNRQLANRLGVEGTPAFIINGTFAPGYVEYEELKAIIAQE